MKGSLMPLMLGTFGPGTEHGHEVPGMDQLNDLVWVHDRHLSKGGPRLVRSITAEKGESGFLALFAHERLLQAEGRLQSLFPSTLLPPLCSRLVDAPVTGTYTLTRCARDREHAYGDTPSLAGDPSSSGRAPRARPVALQGDLPQEAPPGAHSGLEARGDR